MLRLKLNSLDRYFLAQERSTLSFVSNMVLELSQPVDRAKLQSAVSRLEAEGEIGRIRMGIERLRFVRNLVPKSQSRIPIVSFEDAKTPFNLATEAPLRIGVSHDGRQLIFSMHHSAGDGSGQLYVLSNFFKAWQGISLAPDLNYVGFRMREVLHRVGLEAVVEMAVAGVGSLFKKKKNARTLALNPVTESRAGTRIEISFGTNGWQQIVRTAKQHRATPFEWIAYQYAQALDETAKSTEGLVTLIVPVDVRSKLKVPHGLQNCVGLLWVTLQNAGEAFDAYQSRFRAQIRSNQALHFLPIAGLITTFFNSKKSAAILQHEEKSSSGVYSTSLFSYGKIPADIQAPEDLNLVRIRGYGALERSPGLTLTGLTYGSETALTLQYLTDGFEHSVMQGLVDNLKRRLS